MPPKKERVEMPVFEAEGPKKWGEPVTQKEKQVIKSEIKAGFKHMLKYSSDTKDLLKGGKPFAKLKKDKAMVKRVKEKLDHLEEVVEIDELEEDKRRLERAKAYAIEERKWINEVVARIDIVPEEGNYYDKLPVKPGFDFWQALISVRSKPIQLKVMIPEILFYNHSSHLFRNDAKTGAVVIEDDPGTQVFIDLISSKVKYEIAANETKAGTVLRMATEHPCYMTVNLLNWR